MADIYQNTDRMWFGTREKMGWIETPQSGANVSSSGMTAEVDLLSGGAYVRNSIDSHKNFSFSWGDSADTTLASALRAYANGTYGRGLIYFQDPMYFETNVLPQRWADPSMAVDFEAPDLTGGRFRPSSAVTAPNSHGLPVRSAFYSFPVNANLDGVRDGDALFIPVPEGMELVVGAYYTATGSARVKVRADGSASKITELPQTPVGNPTSMLTVIREVGYVELYLSTAVTGVASTLQIAGITARLRPVGSGSLAEGTVATNLFTNPNLLPDTTPREVARNLFPNPNLVGDGTMVEVRRNLMLNPSIRPATTTSWMRRSEATSTVPTIEDGWVKTTVIVTNGGGMYQPGVTSPSIYRSMKFKFKAPAGVKVRGMFYNETDAVWQATPPGMIATGAEQTYTLEGVTFPANKAVRAYVRLDEHAGDLFVCDFLCTDTPTIQGECFDGRYSPDPDLTPSWTGAPNASASILSGELTRGVTTTNCVAIVSTKFAAPGEKSMRLIPTSGAGNASYAEINIPSPIRASGMAIGTVHLDAPLAGSLEARARSLAAFLPEQKIVAPNTAGSYGLRVNFSTTSLHIVRFYHGGALGSGDVYWTRPGLFAGNYEGDWFAGNSDTGDTDVTHAWASTPNNSASIRSVKPVRALTGGYSSDKYPGRALALKVPAGQVASLPVVAPSTVLARAATAGQVLLGDTAVEVRRNLITNPRGQFSGSPTGFRVAVSWFGAGGTGANSIVTGALDGPELALGDYIRKTWSIVGAGLQEITASLAANAPVLPGETFTFSMYWRSSWIVGGIRNMFKVRGFATVGGAEVWAPPIVSSPYPAVNAWQRISATVTIPAGVNFITVAHDLYADHTGASAGMTLDIAGVAAEKSATLNPYFDGYSLPTVNGIPKWEGTPNASASIMYGANVAESVAPGQPLKVQALTTAAMLPGEWVEAGVVAGDYGDGPWFAGSTPGAAWTGASDNSTSTYLLPIAGELGSGDWFTGEGNSGCKFVGKPTLFNNNGVGGGQVSLACELRETGSWA